jgi:DNA-directed RNA polymerase specialized sigma24 family protein
MERDDYKQVRRLLWHWGRADRRIGELTEEIRLARDRANALYDMGGSSVIDGLPHGTTPGDPVFRAVERIEHMRELFAREIEECESAMRDEQEFKAAMREAMDTLKPVEREVLTLRYRGGHSWEYVGIMMQMDESTARRYERSACDALDGKVVFGKVRRVEE